MPDNFFDQFDSQSKSNPGNFFDKFDSQQSEQPTSTWADVAKSIPSGITRGVSSAIGLPGEIGHGMRYLTDQARQAMGYDANPDYVAGTGKYAAATALTPETKDVISGVEKVTGPLYQPQTSAGRFTNTVSEMAGASALPIGNAGAGVAREVAPYVKNWLASSIGAGTAGEAAKEVGAPAPLQAAAAIAGGHYAPGAFLKGPPDPRTIAKTEAADAASQEGITVPKAAVASSLMKPVAGRIASFPLVGSPLQNAARTSLDQTSNRVQEIADAYGQGNAAIAGGEISDAIQKYITKTNKETVRQLYDKVDNLVTPDVKVQPTETLKLISRLQSPATISQRNINDSVIKMALPDLEKANPSPLQTLETKLQPAGLTYTQIKQMRTNVGAMLDDKLLPQAGTTKPVLKQLWGSLTDDLRSSIEAAGGQPALTMWEKANSVAKKARERQEQLTKIVGIEGDVGDEQVFNRILSMASNSAGSANVKRLTAARKAVGPEGWDDLSSAFIRRMGVNPKTEEFSPDRFLSAYGKLSPEGKQLLFNSTNKGELAKSLDNLSKVSKQFSEFYKMGNPSGTAGGNLIMHLFGGFGAIGGLINPAAWVGSLAGMGGMWSTAQWFSRPANVDKMTRTLQARLRYERNPNPAAAQQLTNAIAALMTTTMLSGK